jgi:hypothetical protein
LKKGERFNATTGPSTTTVDQAAFGAKRNTFNYVINASKYTEEFR